MFRVVQGDSVLAVGTPNESQGVIALTDAQGIAQTTFKLGARAGQGNHQVRAKAVGFDGEAIFYASANANIGDKVSVNSGNNQRGAAGQPLPLPFVVAITDGGANYVQGATIEFTVIQGSGKFHNGETTLRATTDSDGRASAQYILGNELGMDIHRVSAILVGTELSAGFTASGLKPGDPGQTSVSGLVLDNQDQPLANVTLRVDGTTRQATTNEQGQFKITNAPVGPVHLIADPSTTTAPGEWPTLSYNLVTVAGADNPLSAPIYLVKLDTEHAVLVGKDDATITLPEVPGFKLTVKKGSVTFPNGAREGLLSVTPVNSTAVPMAPPNGMQPQFIVTIQPTGAMFDPPAQLSLPNVDGHKPGAEVEMYSYDHDLEEFVAIGLGTVTADGSVIESNPGVGVIKAGWHCGSQPGGSSCASSCGDCKRCSGSSDCRCVNDDNKKPTDKCKTCKAGSPIRIAINATARTRDNPVKLTDNNEATFEFEASATSTDCSNVTYEWDFDDGETSQQARVSHSYKNLRGYKAVVRVSCDSCTEPLATKTVFVDVLQPFIYSPSADADLTLPDFEVEASAVDESLVTKMEWGVTVEGTPSSTYTQVNEKRTFHVSSFPVRNSAFGKNEVKLNIHTQNGFAEKSIPVKLFFPKDSSENPTQDPNWYYYWSQTKASHGAHVYDSGCTKSYGYFKFRPVGEYVFHVCPAAGIDINEFAVTTIHENTHLKNYWAWWGGRGGYDANAEALDADGDYVPDDIEPALGLDPTNPDTDNDGWNDEHDFAYDAEKSWVPHSADSDDWSEWGRQYLGVTP